MAAEEVLWDQVVRDEVLPRGIVWKLVKPTTNGAVTKRGFFLWKPRPRVNLEHAGLPASSAPSELLKTALRVRFLIIWCGAAAELVGRWNAEAVGVENFADFGGYASLRERLLKKSKRLVQTVVPD